MSSKLAVLCATLLASSCATGDRISYDAKSLGAGEYNIAFTSIALGDEAHARALAQRVSATCGGAYVLREVSEEDIVGIDDSKDTPRKTTRAILSCEKAA